MTDNIMRVGVTGTRSGMTVSQFSAVSEMLITIIELGVTVPELHHGDCVGVDVEVAMLAQSLGFRTVCHPPTKNDLRAYHASSEIRAPLSYFARNRAIVDVCDVLMVVPFQKTHQSSGGTWYTHDYAVKNGKEPVVFYGDGE